MIKNRIIYFIGLFSLCCCEGPFLTITRSNGSLKEVIVYPPERSEIDAMQIGDTINLFYKKTGWFNISTSSRVIQKTTFYSMETIWRTDSAKFLSAFRWAYPEKWFGNPLDFNSLKNNPKVLFETLGKLEYWCGSDTIINWDGNYQECIESFSHSPADSIAFRSMRSRELTSERFQNWRFNAPTKEQLSKLIESIKSESGFYFYEILLVSKDTIKVSYSEKCTARFPLVYAY